MLQKLPRRLIAHIKAWNASGFSAKTATEWGWIRAAAGSGQVGGQHAPDAAGGEIAASPVDSTIPALSLSSRTPSHALSSLDPPRILIASVASSSLIPPPTRAVEMSEADATTKPVEAVQPEAAPVEEKPVEQTEEKVEEKTEEKADSTEEKPVEEKPTEGSDSKLLKTTAKIDYENHRNNRKFDPASREVTDDPVAIRKQVEFYFGDYNFPQDKFMWESCGGAENKPMKLKTIHSFKRMRTFQPYSAIVAAIKESTVLDLSGEEGEEEVKRKEPYKPMTTAKAKIEAATVYVKGFGDETPNTQFDLETYFAQYGEVKGLKLRRTNENLFKGSAFITFADEETSTKFLALDPAPKWKEHELKIMSKKAYCDEKNDLIRQGKLEPNASNPKKFYEGKDGNNRNARGRGRGGADEVAVVAEVAVAAEAAAGGNRDGGRDRDGPRDRNAERKENETKHSSNDTMPRIQSTAETNGKRSRDDDGASGEPAAKKVDVKQD
ncbi:hypothetical protein G7Z17_g10246 [Cylindrodendrum hubeiense]|uniref:Uncharacterized protein n=1 Tax=Cylindrodendrum hubeiense TaxID=595255 RepID=A0A9P5LCI1_9HYPO|nr:hypothetical protein G7Z17_g10246 [Cylindrodendrum hubeiense]